MKKRYVALVHGWPERPRSTISAEISRDAIRRIRMTTRGSGGRTAVTHYEVRERIESPLGTVKTVFTFDTDPNSSIGTTYATGRMTSAKNDGYTWLC